MSTTPILSPDGHWQWDPIQQQWIPRQTQPVAPVAEPAVVFDARPRFTAVPGWAKAILFLGACVLGIPGAVFVINLFNSPGTDRIESLTCDSLAEDLVDLSRESTNPFATEILKFRDLRLDSDQRSAAVPASGTITVFQCYGTAVYADSSENSAVLRVTLDSEGDYFQETRPVSDQAADLGAAASAAPAESGETALTDAALLLTVGAESHFTDYKEYPSTLDSVPGEMGETLPVGVRIDSYSISKNGAFYTYCIVHDPSQTWLLYDNSTAAKTTGKGSSCPS